jgi:hypothetical protein
LDCPIRKNMILQHNKQVAASGPLYSCPSSPAQKTSHISPVTALPPP